MGVKDGLASLQESSVTFSGTDFQGGTGSFTGINGITSLNFPAGYIGSPILGNTTIMAGTVTTSGGLAADGVITFGSRFAIAPTAVWIIPLASVAVGGPFTTGIAAGSATFRAGSNVAHGWIAIGSGRI